MFDTESIEIKKDADTILSNEIKLNFSSVNKTRLFKDFLELIFI